MSFNIAKRTIFSSTIFSSIIAASSISTLALAQQQEGFTLTPSIGYYNMDNDRDIKEGEAYSLGLGYQFNNPWAVEFVYLNADTKQAGNGNKVDVNQYRLDGLYHLPSINTLNLTPYLAAGVGSTNFSGPSESDNLQINAGGGLKYAVNNAVSLRADFRLVNDVEDHHLDNITSLGVQMTFGSPTQSSTSSNDGYTSVEDAEPTYTQVESEPEPQQATQIEAVPSEPVTSEPVTEQPETSMAQEEPSDLEQPPVPDAHPPLSLDIQFANNKTDVEQKFYPEIEKLATYLKQNPDSTVVIEGHTDDRGAASYNQTISEKRAKAITNVLIRTFEIDETRVRAIGYGEQEPLVSNDSAENRQANRRVVAVISSNEA